MSLIELLVSLSIIAFLSLLAYHPIFSSLHQKKEAVLLSTLFHALHYARQEAIHRQQIVSIQAPSSLCVSPWFHAIVVATIPEHHVLYTHPIDSAHLLSTNRACGFYFNAQGRCLTPGTLAVGSHLIIINDSGRPRLAESPIFSY